MATMTSQDFNRNPTSVKRQADEGPVFITERGEPAYVGWSRSRTSGSSTVPAGPL